MQKNLLNRWIPLAGLVVWILFARTASTAATFIRQSGTRLMNGTTEFKPAGVNLGNWLVQETYMMGVNTDEATMIARLRTAAGSDANYAAWLDAWRSQYITADDIQFIRQCGFNTVRVPLNMDDYLDANGQAVDTGLHGSPLPLGAPVGLKYLDNLINECAAHGVYVLLDMHRYGAWDSTIFVSSDTENNPVLNRIKAAWGTVARRYRDVETLLGYDLLNEPPGFNDSKLRPTHVQLRNAVRAVDTNHLIVVESNVYSDLGTPSFWYLGTPIDANLAISPHYYGGTVPASLDADAPNGRKYLAWLYASTYQLPLLIGEFGENNNTWDNEMMRLWATGKDGLTAGTLFWTYKKPGDSVRAIVSVPYVAGWDSIQNYVNNGGTPPSDAYTILMNMAAGTQFSAITFRRDVWDSLVRPYTSNLPAVTGQAIPGRIDAVNYDFGANGSAYYSTRTDNPGWRYRNDCVGINARTDPGTGYVVGFTSAGQWLRYTVSAQPGVYQLNIRHALSGTIRVSVNGQNISGNVSLPDTGGWWIYQTRTVANVTMPANGTATVEVGIEGGSPDLNWIEFQGLPTPQGLAATALSGTTIRLTWTDPATTEQGYRIERKTGAGGAYSQIVALAANSTAYDDLNLSPGTTYFYRVRAYNATDLSAYSAEASATTLSTPPAAPTGLTATRSSQKGRINLAWTASAGATSYQVKRSTTSGGPYTTIKTGMTTTTYTDSGLTSGRTYYYVVSALNAGGESANSNQASATAR